MWILPVNRRELVGLMTLRGAADVAGAVEVDRLALPAVDSGAMAAVWPIRPAEFGSLPTAIIVHEASQRDSLAWLATYVRDLRPFTAYCRVVDLSVAKLLLRGPSAPNLVGMEGICSGMILGEALAQTGGRASIPDLPSTTYSATLSYAISRALALTRGSFSPEVVARLWAQARELTGQGALAVDPSAILSVWSLALHASEKLPSLFDPRATLAAALHNLRFFNEISDPVWDRLVEGYPGFERMRGLLGLPREQRVQIIDGALRFIASSRRDDAGDRGFLAGYLTSLLGPGTLDHAEFLKPVATALPTAYLWYGLCAGLKATGDALPVGNPLARRIIRDLTIPDRLIDRPRCDVALEELVLYGPGGDPALFNANAGRLYVDLLPGVTSVVRWPSREAPRSDGARAAEEIELRHLILEMEDSSLRLRSLAGRVLERLRAEGIEPPVARGRKRGEKS